MQNELDPDSSPAGEVEDGIATRDEKRDAYAAALLRERDGLIARGRGDRVSQVEAELERIGYERVERAEVEPKAERATKKRG